MIREDHWPIEDFKIKAEALKSLLEKKKLKTLSIDLRTGTQITATSRRKRAPGQGLEQSFRDQVKDIIANHVPKVHLRWAFDTLSTLWVEHLQELQLSGSQSTKNMTFTDSKFNSEMGNQLNQQLEQQKVKPGSIVDEIVVQVRQSVVHQATAKKSNANELRLYLLVKAPHKTTEINFLFKGFSEL
jgi:preprotein translocase subunit SecD